MKLEHDYGLHIYRQVSTTAEVVAMPLHVAVFQGHEKVVEALLAAKADVTVVKQVHQTTQAPSKNGKNIKSF